MVQEPELKELSAQPTLSIRTRSPVEHLGRTLGKAFAQIGEYLGELHAQPSGAPFAAYYNADMHDLDVEIGMPVPAPLPGRDPIAASWVPAGKYAACLYTGPYSKISEAYDTLVKWIADKGYAASGVSYEIYLSDQAHTPAEQLQTLVMLALQ